MRNWQQFSVSPGTMGSREYVKDVWEESKYIKPLEITVRRRINPPRVMMRHMAYVSFTKDHESPYGDWMTMIFEAFALPRENGIWWIGSGENRRRDDDEAAPEEEAKVKMKEIELILTGRRSLMRQPLRGNRGRGRSSMMPRKMLKALRNRSMRFQQMLHPARLNRRTRA
ncbi:hypothetical protein Dimus_029344 [Dionaea muscipula]